MSATHTPRAIGRCDVPVAEVRETFAPSHLLGTSRIGDAPVEVVRHLKDHMVIDVLVKGPVRRTYRVSVTDLITAALATIAADLEPGEGRGE